MIANIKSANILKIVFSYISEENKLGIIKCNKRLQNILNISIINYKLLSGRYIILEENNKGKEYYFSNNSLIYEGEYLNLRRNGKGKEYNLDGVLLYEGEYKDGKRNGKGKEYNSIGLLIFDGIFTNREKWKGKIK